MSNKQQTAVDWLREQFHKVPQSQFGNLFEQAKAKEKEQIENAWLDGHGTESDNEGFSARICINEYYTETYEQ